MSETYCKRHGAYLPCHICASVAKGDSFDSYDGGSTSQIFSYETNTAGKMRIAVSVWSNEESEEHAILYLDPNDALRFARRIEAEAFAAGAIDQELADEKSQERRWRAE